MNMQFCLDFSLTIMLSIYLLLIFKIKKAQLLNILFMEPISFLNILLYLILFPPPSFATTPMLLSTFSIDFFFLRCIRLGSRSRVLSSRKKDISKYRGLDEIKVYFSVTQGKMSVVLGWWGRPVCTAFLLCLHIGHHTTGNKGWETCVFLI